MKFVILWFHTFPLTGLCFKNENVTHDGFSGDNRVKYWFEKNKDGNFNIRQLNEKLLKELENHRITYCKNLMLPLFHGEKRFNVSIGKIRRSDGNYSDENVTQITKLKYIVKLEDFVNYVVTI